MAQNSAMLGRGRTALPPAVAHYGHQKQHRPGKAEWRTRVRLRRRCGAGGTTTLPRAPRPAVALVVGLAIGRTQSPMGWDANDARAHPFHEEGWRLGGHLARLGIVIKIHVLDTPCAYALRLVSPVGPRSRHSPAPNRAARPRAYSAPQPALDNLRRRETSARPCNHPWRK